MDERSQVCGCAAEKWNRSVRLIARDDQLNNVVGIHPAEQAIDAEVDLNMAGDDYFLGARLNVSLAGLEREVAQAWRTPRTRPVRIPKPYVATSTS